MSNTILPPNSTIINTITLSPQILTTLYTINNNGEFVCITNNNAYEAISVEIQINDVNSNIFYQNNYTIPSGMSAIIFNNENNYTGYSVLAQTNAPNTSVVLATNTAIPSASSLFILIPNLASYLNISNTPLINNTSNQSISNLDTIIANINTELSYQATNIEMITTNISEVTATVTGNSDSISTLNTDIVNINSELSSQITSIENLQLEVGLNNTNIESISSDLSTVTDNLNSNNATILSIGNDLSNINQSVSTLNTDIVNINSELSSQITSISMISSDLSTVTDAVDVLNGQSFKLLQPISSENITLGNSLRTTVIPKVSSTATFTLEPGNAIGQEVIIFGSNAEITVQSNVTSGTPFFILPDNSEIHSWTISVSSYAQGIILRWDGNSWRAQTFGRTITAPAIYDNEAVSLSQITGMQSILFDSNNFLPIGNVPLPAEASLTQTTPGGYFNYNGEIYEIPTHTKTYSAGTDTYEYVDSMGNITYLEVSSGSAPPVTPVGTVPFQKVSTTILDTPSAPMGVASTSTTSSMSAGVYDYQIVAINPSGNSLPSPTLSLTIAANGAADLAWRLVPYQTLTEIYRNGNLLTTVTGQTYTDTAVSATGGALPSTNTSNFVYVSTPLYDVINTVNNKVINLGLFGPLQGTDITALLLGCLNYASSIYKSSSYNTEYGSQPSSLMNAVRVVIPDGQFEISQSIVVPSGITLDFDGLIINNLSDVFTPCIIWGIGSFSNMIQVNANSNSGIQLGTYSTQNNIRFGGIRIASGGQIYNSILGISQVGVFISGYNVTIDTIQTYTANIGLELSNASDVRIGRCISVGCATGLSLSGCEQVGIDFIDVDSPQYLAAVIDSSHDITITGTAWINDISYGGSANAHNFIQIGTYSSAQPLAGLNLRFNILNCGSIPLSVSNIDQSHIDVVVGTGDLFTGTSSPPQSVISYGPSVGNGFLLTGTAVITTASNWANSTTPAGSYNIFINGTSTLGNSSNTATIACTSGLYIDGPTKVTGSSTLNGTTAGSVTWTMPQQGTFKEFIAYFNGYENDTTTNQTITFPTGFINDPMIDVNQTGLNITVSTTTLTITAPNTTTTYTGYVVIKGI